MLWQWFRREIAMLEIKVMYIEMKRIILIQRIKLTRHAGRSDV